MPKTMKVANEFTFVKDAPVPDDFYGMVLTEDGEMVLGCYTLEENANHAAIIVWNPSTKLFSPRWIPLCDVRAWARIDDYMERS